MPAPIAVLVVDLADGVNDVVVGETYLGARVLTRWQGTPLGVLEIPVILGRVRAGELYRAAMDRLAHPLFVEIVRRHLLDGGVPADWTLPTAPLPKERGIGAWPTATVAVCTRDRPEDLARCLTAIGRLHYPGEKQVLVVDNAPKTDATAVLVRDRFPWADYVREDRPGLDNARNRAVLEARGEILAYTDDDVVVDADWLTAIGRAFASDDRVGAVSGFVMPFQLERDAEFLFEAGGGFGRGFKRREVIVPSDEPVPQHLFGTGQFGTGANMAYRRSIFADIGLFDPALDVGTATNGGGDLEMFFRVIRSGWALVYEPSAIVRHRHRQTYAELRRQFTDHGIGFRSYCERIDRMFPEERTGLRNLKRWWWRYWAWDRWRQAVWRPTEFPRDLIVAEIVGFWRGRGRYASVRAKAGVKEADPPDRLTKRRPPPSAPDDFIGGSHIWRVDASEPVAAIPGAGRYDEAVLAVHWRGRPIRNVHLATERRGLSADRVAAEVAAWCWPELLVPARDLPPGPARELAFSRWMERWGIGLESWPPLPPEVTVSIVVATRDRPVDLRRCLQSLALLQTPRPVEVVVVDNHPESGLTAAVVQDFPSLTIVNETRAGLSYARNAGIAAARGTIIVATDDDVVVPPDWLENLVAPFVRSDVLAVTGNVLPARLSEPAERMFERYGGLGRGEVRREFGPAWFHWFRRRAVPTWEIGATANAAFRAEVFSRPDIGAMDEALGAGAPTGCSEDTLVFYRILAAGGVIIYDPAAYVWHHHRTTDAALRHQLYSYTKGHVAYHLRTWQLHRDSRALVRVAAEMPLSFARRIWHRLRGWNDYPMRLLGSEIAGAFAGPLALWRANRRVRRLGPGARRPDLSKPDRPAPGAH